MRASSCSIHDDTWSSKHILWESESTFHFSCMIYPSIERATYIFWQDGRWEREKKKNRKKKLGFQVKLSYEQQQKKVACLFSRFFFFFFYLAEYMMNRPLIFKSALWLNVLMDIQFIFKWFRFLFLMKINVIVEIVHFQCFHLKTFYFQ